MGKIAYWQSSNREYWTIVKKNFLPFLNQEFENFSSKLRSESDRLLSVNEVTEAAHVYDAATVIMETWRALTPQDKHKPNMQFAQEFTTKAKSLTFNGLSVSTMCSVNVYTIFLEISLRRFSQFKIKLQQLLYMH